MAEVRHERHGLDPELAPKSNEGGIHLELDSDAEVTVAYDEMASDPRARMTGAMVQPMAGPGIETITGVV